MTGKKIAERKTKVSKNSQQNNSETFTNEHDKEIIKEMHIYIYIYTYIYIYVYIYIYIYIQEEDRKSLKITEKKMTENYLRLI